MEKKRNTIDHSSDVIDLGKLFKFLLSKFWIILLWVVALGAGAFVFTKELIVPQYAATSKIYIVSASKGSVVDLSDLQLGTNLTSDYVELMMNRPMLEEIIQNLSLDMTPPEIAKMISIENPADTRELCITATGQDPKTVKDIANEMAVMSIKYLPQLMKTEEPTMVEDALLPNAPVSPSYPKNVMMGALAGFVLSAGYYTIRFLNNDVFESDLDVFNSLGEMPLATVELNSSTKKKRSKKNKKTSLIGYKF